jgi:hypothetical protein
MKKTIQFVAIAGIMAVLNAPASLVYNTGSSATSGGNPVDAQATLTFGNGTLTLILQNLQSGEISSGQAISGINLSGISDTISLTSANGNLVNVVGSTVTPLTGGTDASLTRWGLDQSSGLWALTGGQPEEMIVGPSPAGNNGFKNFNPYVDQTATFIISDPAFTANTTVSGVSFLFGTSGGEATLTGNLHTPTPVPEPSTLFAGVLLLLPLGVGAIRVLSK